MEGESKGYKVELEVIDERKYAIVWRSSILEKKLLYDSSLCNGCGVCVKACPLEAITLGPVREIIEGKIEAPKIMVDETKCIVCPICSSVCLFNALRYEVKPAIGIENPRIKGSIRILEEKCVPCRICEAVCPLEAIKAELKIPKKGQLVIYEGSEKWGEGFIEVYEEKCVYCGLCSELCDAIEILWIPKDEVKAPDYRYAVGIKVDVDKCDYCGLCEEICPYDAIKVECRKHAPRIIKELKWEGRVAIDEQKCIYCGLCAAKCPKNAIELEKPFEGEIVVLDVEECDPSGCKNCQLACPVKAFYIPRSGESKIRVASEYCIYCGACANVCPADAISIVRLDANVTPSKAPFSLKFNEQVNNALTGFKAEKSEARVKVSGAVEEEVREERVVWEKPGGFDVIKKSIAMVKNMLGDPRFYRKIILKSLREA